MGNAAAQHGCNVCSVTVPWDVVEKYKGGRRYLWLLQDRSFLVEVLNQTLPLVSFLSSITLPSLGTQSQAESCTKAPAFIEERLPIHQGCKCWKKQCKPEPPWVQIVSEIVMCVQLKDWPRLVQHGQHGTASALQQAGRAEMAEPRKQIRSANLWIKCVTETLAESGFYP